MFIKYLIVTKARHERHKKFLRRHNLLEAIAIIAIVLSGRCPGVICPGVQLSLEEIVWVQLSWGNFPSWKLSGGQLSQVAIVRVAIVLEELSCSHMLHVTKNSRAKLRHIMLDHEEYDNDKLIINAIHSFIFYFIS